MISVIIPVFNIEKYINKCIESVVNQTYTDLEIILVDDGSTDTSPVICDEWKEKDARINVFHKKNGGVSSARNFGISKANGEYVMFVDGDDYIVPTALQKLMETAIETKADTCVCNYTSECQGVKCDEIMPIEYKIYNNKEILYHYFIGKYCALVTPWCNLYKRELFTQNNIEYPEGRLSDDEFTSYKLLWASRKTAVLSQPLYVYVQRPGSITNTPNIKLTKDLIDSVGHYVEFGYNLQDEDIKKWVNIAAFKWYCSLVQQSVNWNVYNEDLFEMMKEFEQDIKKYTASFFSNEYADLNSKKRYILMKMGLLRTYYLCRKYLSGHRSELRI